MLCGVFMCRVALRSGVSCCVVMWCSVECHVGLCYVGSYYIEVCCVGLCRIASWCVVLCLVVL